jgi:hypothetical protein
MDASDVVGVPDCIARLLRWGPRGFVATCRRLRRPRFACAHESTRVY